ncbi:MAG: hypothetical protein GX419_06190 [Bacteroidales bacterium]|jgi:hypothetical protein|nr:hypothetical protein [Bacteroidales bacterium]
MKKGIVVVGLMLISAMTALYAGEKPRSLAPVKEDLTMVYSEPVAEVEAWMLEIFSPASVASEVVTVESWMLCPELFMGDVSYEPVQEVEAWMLGEYFTGLPVSDKEEPMAVEPWMLSKEWI